MSMEEIVRQKHEFEARVNRFLKQVRDYSADCKAMKTRDMEICIARLYDLMSQAAGEAERLDELFKGFLVKRAYEKRKAGEPYSAWRNFWSRPLFNPENMVRRQFDYPVPLTEELASQWATGNAEAIRKSLPSGGE